MAAASLAAVLGAAGANAQAAVRVVDVPGASGRAVSIVAAGRLADGGAIVAGTLTPRGSRPRVLVMRLRHDGLVDTSFGDAGVVRVQLSRGSGRRGSSATAVAVDPERGRAWIGASIGSERAGAVLALDSRGRRVHGFGSNAVVRFAGSSTAPAAIAFGGGRLAVAATTRPCRGCQVLLLDPRSGRREAQAALAPVAGADAASCAGAQLTSLALVGDDRLVLGGSGDAACPARVVVRDGALRPIAEWDPGEAGARTVVAAAGAPLDLCAGIESAGAARLVRVAAGSAAPTPATATLPARTSAPVTGSIAGVVALGAGGCGALLLRAGKPARVLQAGTGGAPSVVELPARLRAGAISRCKRHVLVIGTRRTGGVVRAAVAVTAIVSGGV
jgi:hypothetical protein